MVRIKIKTPGNFVLNGIHFTGPAELIVDEKDIELIKRECAVHGIAYEIEQTKTAKESKQEVKAKEVDKAKKEPETKANETQTKAEAKKEPETKARKESETKTANETQTKAEAKKEPETKTEVVETEKPRRGRRKKA